MLSPEQFSELLTVIETTRDQGPKPEVRRAPRVNHPCRITITLGNNLDAGSGVLVQLRDISARGMCFLHNEDMPRNAIFVVNLEAPSGENVAILSTVVHCHQLDKHTFQVGAEFTCTLGKPPVQTCQETAEDLMRIRSSILR